MSRVLRVLSLRLSAVAVSLLVAVPVLAAPVSAQSGGGCDDLVVDSAGALGASGVSQVESVARALGRDHGAVVRVRVESTVPDGEPKRFVADQVASCGSWSRNGERHPRLLAVVVATEDRATGVYFGGALGALDRVEASVQSQVMNPRFADGDFAAGVAEGLSRFDAALSGDLPSGTPSREPLRERRVAEPFPWGRFLTGAGSLAGLAAAVALVWFAARRVRLVRARRVRLAGLVERRSELGAEVFALNAQLEAMGPELAVIAGHDEDRGRLAGLRDKANTAVAGALEAASSVTLPAPHGVSEGTLDAVAGELDGASARLSVAVGEVAALQETIARLSQVDASGAAELEDARGELAQVEALVSEARTLGFDVAAHATAAADAARLLDEAESALRARRRFGFVDTCDAAGRLIEEAEEAGTLPGRHAAAVTALEELTFEVDTLGQREREVVSLLAGLAGRWDGSALERFVGAADGAASSLAEARSRLGGCSTEPGSFCEDTEVAVREVGALVQEGVSLLDSAAGAPEALETAAREAQRVAAEAQRVADRVAGHRYGRALDVSRLGAVPGGDPFAAMVAAQEVLDSARVALRDAERELARVREAQAAAAAAASRARDRSYDGGGFGGGSSSSFGGGGSSSSFGGGGSSSKW